MAQILLQTGSAPSTPAAGWASLYVLSGTSVLYYLNDAGVTSSFAPVNAPTFTGVPAAPTASPGTNTTQIATTAFVTAAAYAPLASPTFTGTPTAPTATAGTNTTQLATTAFVQASLTSASSVGSTLYLNENFGAF